MNMNFHETGLRPTIAILTVADNSRIFRGDRRNFADLARTGSEHGAIVYVVTASDLKLTGKKLLGYRYDSERKTWRRELLPSPHVVYNRVPYRKMEMWPEVQQTIQACTRSNKVKLFNPAFFNKWSLFEWLGNSQATKKYIPVTGQLSSYHELDAMLRKHPIVYLKPIKGKAGRGIMRLERKAFNYKEPEYRLSVQNNKTVLHTTHDGIESSWEQIREYKGSKEYIMQQGIELARFKERAYDLRTLVQKTSQGNWSVTGIGARVAGKLSITTHVPRGGYIDNPRKLLTHAFGRVEALRILKRTKLAALTIAKRIEISSGYQLGEMSMDLGVDTMGRIWFFEANSKPMKFDEPDIRKKSLQRIVEYSLFLMKKSKRR